MAVKKQYHHKGLGRLLIEAIENETSKKYGLLQVKTVDEGHYPQYDETNVFYQKCGFKKLEVFPDLWNKNNPCLILVKAL
ncbi:GNAT family N-acetyltransferase [Facklamia miroungae]|uniref:Acetyltransferase (GNAT) domain-containing protein n=1 Tax=Facklamia miroungae TaxID=120956 RepID=A0A1G7RUB5_9LACT|nr:GNAT family N-acetyltransferase [Facklamia miroungae]SDG14358.1 Acetyltransferase (GNAT) domain-containing protein [Facklamia miroungae]